MVLRDSTIGSLLSRFDRRLEEQLSLREKSSG